MLLHHLPAPQNLENKALTRKSQGRCGSVPKTPQGMVVSSQISSVDWTRSAPTSHTQGPKILLYLRAPTPWVQASSLQQAMAQKLHLKWVESMSETVGSTDSWLKKIDLE